jgi:hypothetical protein
MIKITRLFLDLGEDTSDIQEVAVIDYLGCEEVEDVEVEELVEWVTERTGFLVESLEYQEIK